jgi:hypothetical protein
MLKCFVAWLHNWQPLVGATVALIAALIAVYFGYRNTTRSLDHAGKLETRRRRRKHAAVRAVLPLALAQVLDYAERSARALDELLNACDGEELPSNTAPETLAQPLPSETLKALADFIEYSDDVDVSVVEATVAWIQIHDSRLRGLVEDNHDPSGTRMVLRTGIMARIIDAASIYAGAAAVFEYARRQREQLPRILTWDAVTHALRNMHFFDDEYPGLHEMLARREALSAGPFERLREGLPA